MKKQSRISLEGGVSILGALQKKNTYKGLFFDQVIPSFLHTYVE